MKNLKVGDVVAFKCKGVDKISFSKDSRYKYIGCINRKDFIGKVIY